MKIQKSDTLGPDGLVPRQLFKKGGNLQILKRQECPERKIVNFEYNIAIVKYVQKARSKPIYNLKRRFLKR